VLAPLNESVLPHGIRSRLVAGINGLTVHVLASIFRPGWLWSGSAAGWMRGLVSAGQGMLEWSRVAGWCGLSQGQWVFRGRSVRWSRANRRRSGCVARRSRSGWPTARWHRYVDVVGGRHG
jgi:hypothetical protein